MPEIPFLSRKVRPLIGVDISSSSVKMVELSGDGKSGYQVERYAIEPLPREAVADGNIANLEAVAESLRRCLRRMASNTKLVAMALPASSVITKRIVLPGGLREQEMELQVESEANQYIPFALEEVNLDFQVLGQIGDTEDVDVMIAASRKEKVEDRVAAAESAGLKAQVVDVESFAALAAFELVAGAVPGGASGKIMALV
ncbi:MAG: type IV pilus assembly protein PilM, partial [Rhodocyclaceae bacterium]|nr:type IV pilus assembly protein PilM [Rhodocyclaceae bacterium]